MGAPDGDRELGQDPYTGEENLAGNPAASGPYLCQTADRPRTPSGPALPKGGDRPPWTTNNADERSVAAARCSASIPKLADVTAGLGLYGPLCCMTGTLANVESIEDVFSSASPRGSVFAGKEAKGGGRSARPPHLKELGRFPMAVRYRPLMGGTDPM